MGMLEQAKIWMNCKKTGRMKEYQQYQECLKRKEIEIQERSKWIKDASDPKEVAKWKYILDEDMLEKKFFRPNSQQDIEYRDKIGNEFKKELQSVLSSNFDLRFHGTPIYFAEQIIKSKKITSTAERYDGYIASDDLSGEISVSNVENLQITLDFFTDLASYMRSLPCGCLFALLPKDENDTIHHGCKMKSVDFNENPHQLFGVVTSPENVDRVKEWMDKAGINSNLTYTFEEFLKVVKQKSNEIDRKMEFMKPIKKEEKNHVQTAQKMGQDVSEKITIDMLNKTLKEINVGDEIEDMEDTR